MARSRPWSRNYKDMIYLPVETSGEGEINAHSRVQMALGEAKNKAKKEFAEALEQTGLTLDEVPRLGGSASGNASGRCTRCRTPRA